MPCASALFSLYTWHTSTAPTPAMDRRIDRSSKPNLARRLLSDLPTGTATHKRAAARQAESPLGRARAARGAVARGGLQGGTQHIPQNCSWRPPENCRMRQQRAACPP
eukprot:3792065-Pyramimonas_sp.AAC.1